MAESIDSIVAYLKDLVERPADLSFGVPVVQNLIWTADDDSETSGSDEDPRWEVLRALAYNLDYYEPDPMERLGNNHYYGEEQAMHRIRQALASLV